MLQTFHRNMVGQTDLILLRITCCGKTNALMKSEGPVGLKYKADLNL